VSEWSCWKNISKTTNCKFYCVFRIRLIDSGKNPIKIGRLLNDDEKGIMLIEKTSGIKARLGNFQRAIKNGKAAHSEGQKLYPIWDALKCKYQNCSLEYSFKKMESEHEIKIEEERLQKCYLLKYGELPPLNANMGNKIKWDNLNCDLD